jgi:hypothetical protein
VEGGGRTGRWLQYAARSHNDLLVSILNLFGDPRQRFGESQVLRRAAAQPDLIYCAQRSSLICSGSPMVGTSVSMFEPSRLARLSVFLSLSTQ